MAFNPATLPADVYAAYKLGPLNWPVVVKTAVQKQITDLDKLASIVFYLHHPERNGQQIGAHEKEMINQWKGFRNLIKPLVPVMSKPDPPKDPSPPPEVIDWVLTPEEEADLRRYGREALEWAQTPPIEDVETYEFLVPQHLRKNYKVLFAWKSNNPKIKCAADSKQTRVKGLLMLRDDMAYWLEAMRGDERLATIRRHTAEVAIRDYRDFIVNRKMCPKAARNRLFNISQDVIKEMIYGFLDFTTNVGMPGTGAISNGLPEAMEFLKKAYDHQL
jgi:hypothetical protein